MYYFVKRHKFFFIYSKLVNNPLSNLHSPYRVCTDSETNEYFNSLHDLGFKRFWIIWNSSGAEVCLSQWQIHEKEGWVASQNSACGIVTQRRDTTLICFFLREVWGGGKGEGNVPSVRASTQPDTTVGTERFCTFYTKVFFRYKIPFVSLLYTSMVSSLIVMLCLY